MNNPYLDAIEAVRAAHYDIDGSDGRMHDLLDDIHADIAKRLKENPPPTVEAHRATKQSVSMNWASLPESILNLLDIPINETREYWLIPVEEE